MDLEAWPDASAGAALEFMAGSVEARDAYLAAFLDAPDHPGADGTDPALVERIMGGIGREQG